MLTDNKNFDLAVIGSGIFGLWIAKRGVEAGLSVVLIEKNRIGSGASGGLLGALMPHIPTGWNEKKQFQFEALVELERLIANLEAETGLTTGYKRTGRVMPLRSERFVDITLQRHQAAQRYWTQQSSRFDFCAAHDEAMDGWLNSEESPHGYVLDTLAARINPRAYINTLKSWLSTKATLLEETSFHRHDGENVWLNEGKEKIIAGATVLAQGYQTFDHLLGHYNLDIGSGVKGQAATFTLDNTDRLPVIYDDGVYIVPHDNGTCAVGSTTEKTWQGPSTPDPSKTQFIEQAIRLCPRLEGLPVAEYWAGVRPKCHEREPVIGRLFDKEALFIATGGFKVSFGIAHRVALALIAEITQTKSTITLPDTFTVDHHLSAYRKRASSRQNFH